MPTSTLANMPVCSLQRNKFHCYNIGRSSGTVSSPEINSVGMNNIVTRRF